MRSPKTCELVCLCCCLRRIISSVELLDCFKQLKVWLFRGVTERYLTFYRQSLSTYSGVVLVPVKVTWQRVNVWWLFYYYIHFFYSKFLFYLWIYKVSANIGSLDKENQSYCFVRELVHYTSPAIVCKGHCDPADVWPHTTHGSLSLIRPFLLRVPVCRWWSWPSCQSAPCAWREWTSR